MHNYLPSDLHSLGRFAPGGQAPFDIKGDSPFGGDDCEPMDAAFIVIVTRSDSAVFVGRVPSLDGGTRELAAYTATPIVFQFGTGEAAIAVLARSKEWLPPGVSDAGGWILGATAGQIAAAIKLEARTMCYDFDLIRAATGRRNEVERGLGWWVLRLICGIAGIAMGVAMEIVINYASKGQT